MHLLTILIPAFLSLSLVGQEVGQDHTPVLSMRCPPEKELGVGGGKSIDSGVDSAGQRFFVSNFVYLYRYSEPVPRVVQQRPEGRAGIWRDGSRYQLIENKIQVTDEQGQVASLGLDEPVLAFDVLPSGYFIVHANGSKAWFSLALPDGHRKVLEASPLSAVPTGMPVTLPDVLLEAQPFSFKECLLIWAPAWGKLWTLDKNETVLRGLSTPWPNLAEDQLPDLLHGRAPWSQWVDLPNGSNKFIRMLQLFPPGPSCLQVVPSVYPDEAILVGTFPGDQAAPQVSRKAWRLNLRTRSFEFLKNVDIPDGPVWEDEDGKIRPLADMIRQSSRMIK